MITEFGRPRQEDPKGSKLDLCSDSVSSCQGPGSHKAQGSGLSTSNQGGSIEKFLRNKS